MNKAKLERLHAMGGRVTTAGAFMGLSREDDLLNEIKVELVAMLRETRSEHGLTQSDVARRLGMAQSSVGRIESGGPVTIDTLFRCLVAAGVSMAEIFAGMARAVSAVENEAREIAELEANRLVPVKPVTARKKLPAKSAARTRRVTA